MLLYRNNHLASVAPTQQVFDRIGRTLEPVEGCRVDEHPQPAAVIQIEDALGGLGEEPAA